MTAQLFFYIADNALFIHLVIVPDYLFQPFPDIQDLLEYVRKQRPTIDSLRAQGPRQAEGRCLLGQARPKYRAPNGLQAKGGKGKKVGTGSIWG